MRFLRRLRPAVPQRQARAAVAEIAPGDLTRMFVAPQWLRGLGRISWLLVGVAAILVGVVWILGLTSSIVEPVVTGAVDARGSAHFDTCGRR